MLPTLAIIPARFASTRFPGKPLVDIDGKSMIQRVYEQASMAKSLAKVVVATDDERIFAHVEGFGGNVVMTSTQHRSGTDRCAEVLAHFQNDYPYVVNVQGDEPFIQPQQIDLLVHFIQTKNFGIATLSKRIELLETINNHNVVKVVFGQKSGNALYFSRSPIPFVRDVPADQWLEKFTFFKHIGLYAFRAETLPKLAALPPTPLEVAESLEQLRWLEHGYSIGVVETPWETQGIDVPEDLEKLRGALK